jgi:uncharacterized protein (TIGR02265 family)
VSNANVIPGHLVERVFQKVLAGDITPALADALKAEGLDLSEPIAESYPRTTWFRAIELTSAAMYPSAGSAGQQQRQLGGHIITSLQSKNLIKGPWLTMAKLLGPRRAIKQAADFGAEHSPISLEVKEKGSKELEVTIDGGQQNEFLAGLLEALVGALGGKDARVATLLATNSCAVFSATWR